MVNVFIEGNKTGFKSKSAIEKFKLFIRNNFNNFNLVELNKKFINFDYELKLINKTDVDIKFEIVDNKEYIDKKTILRTKLKIMRDERTNACVKKINSDIVSDDITKEYIKARKSVNIPIPEPSEILQNPEEHKILVKNVLETIKSKGIDSSHPYLRYFTLLDQKITEKLKSSNNIVNQFSNKPEPFQIKDIKADINKDNTDTESDSEIETLS